MIYSKALGIVPTTSVDVISDVHLTNDTLRQRCLEIPKTSNMLILAGDIAKVEDDWVCLIAYLSVCCLNYKAVFYVLGNHEYYSSTGKVDMDTVMTRVQSLSRIFTNLIVLENSCYTIKHLKVVIFGATMWSNADEKIFPSTIPIFSKEDTHITFEKWQLLHFKSRLALSKAIEYAKSIGHKLVVVTHYSPLFNETLEAKYHSNNKNSMYCTDLSSYFPDVNLWIYGHTGFNTDIQRGNTRICSNQYDVPRVLSRSIFIDE